MYRLRGDEIREDWIEDDEASIALDIGDEMAAECINCGRYIEDANDHDDDCTEQDWTPPNGPASWCNAAGIVVKDDAVETWISLGDPRGAFTFQVRRLNDGRLIMHVPYPGESFAHMPLKEHHRGTYIVGESEEPGDYIGQREARALLVALRNCVEIIEGHDRWDTANGQAVGVTTPGITLAEAKTTISAATS